MRSSILIIVTLLIVSGCCSVIRPPGQVVASKDHLEDVIKQYEKGHIKQAIHQFEMAIEKNPANFKAYYYLDLCYKHQGVMERARKHFQKAIDLNPHDEEWVMKVEAEMVSGGSEKEKKK